MTALPRTPTGRIALAMALSVLVHGTVLFAPPVRFPPGKATLPPLTAKLEPLPEIAAKPAAPRKKPRPMPKPAPPVPEAASPDNQVAETTAETEELQPAPEPEPPAPDKPAIETPQETRPAHPLPRYAQLVFDAYKGADLKIGEARHDLEISDDNNYLLKIGMNTTGLASLFKTYESEQQSSGILTPSGLRPGKFSEMKNTSGRRESLEAEFFWAEKSLSFSNGSSTPLPEQAQDIISFIYQLSQMPLDRGTIPMHISNGKKLERYELAVGEEEMIQTGIGRLRALPLRKIRVQGEEGLEIWLGLEYRLLPVKIRMLDRSGQTAGEMVVSEIRVSGE